MTEVDPKYVAPALMLGVAVAAVALAGSGYLQLRAYQHPVAVHCDAALLDDVDDGRWVRLEGCSPLLDEMVAVTTPGKEEVVRLLVPLTAEASPDASVVAVLVIGERERLRHAQRLGDEGAAFDAKLARRLHLDRLEGALRTVRSDDLDVTGFEELNAWERSPEHRPRAIDREDPPDPLMIRIGLGVCALLLPLGLFFLFRALRKPEARLS